MCVWRNSIYAPLVGKGLRDKAELRTVTLCGLTYHCGIHSDETRGGQKTTGRALRRKWSMCSRGSHSGAEA